VYSHYDAPTSREPKGWRVAYSIYQGIRLELQKLMVPSKEISYNIHPIVVRKEVATSVPETEEYSKYLALTLSSRTLMVGPLIRNVLGPKSIPNSLLSGSIGPDLTDDGRVHSISKHS
jgi:hypothetical protein